MEQRQTSYTIPLAIFGFFLGFYLLTARGFIVEADGIINFLTTRALVEERSLALSCQILEEFVVIGRHGNCYSKYDIGLSLTALPLYLLARLISGAPATANPDLFSMPRLLVGITGQIVTAVTCALLYLLAGHFGSARRTAVELAFVFGIATLAWPYATTYFSQPFIAMLLLLAVIMLMPHEPPKTGHLLAAGVALGWACLIRLDSLPLAFLFALYAFYKCQKNNPWQFALQRLAVFAIPVAISLLFYLFFNWLRFGNMVQSGYEGEGWTTPFLTGLYGLTFSPNKGVIFYSPLLLLAFVGLINLWQKGFKAEISLFLALFTTQLLIYSPWWAWEGGWVWGPRFLLSTLPLLSIGLLPWLESAAPRRRILLLIVLTFSFFIQLIGASTDPLVYILRVAQYQEILSNPLYTPLLGQMQDLLARRIALIIATNAQGLFTGAQTVIWAVCWLGLMGVTALKLRNVLNNDPAAYISRKGSNL